MRVSLVLVSAATLVASTLASGASRAAITVYPRQGRAADWTGASNGPGVVVMGGNQDVDDAFVWMQARLAGGSAGGDVVVLRDPDPNAGHDDDYAPYLLGLAKFNSVQTIVLADPVGASELAQAAAIVDAAEGVFFGGGDQRHYVGWRGPLLDAVQRVYDRRGVVGGTSAGGALFGQIVNDAIGQYSHGSTTSANALADPFEPSITFTTGLFAIPALAGAITDTHFHARDRFGRLAAFVARIAGGSLAGSTSALGVGVDEDSALLIDDRGIATLALYAPGRGGAWLLRGGPPADLAPGRALTYSVAVTRLDAAGQRFDLGQRCGDGASYAVAIDGAKAAPYVPVDPYGASAGAAQCGPGGAVDASAPSPDAALPSPHPSDAGNDDGAPDGGSNGLVPPSDALAPPTTGCSCAASPRDARGGWVALAAFVAMAAARRRRNKYFTKAPRRRSAFHRTWRRDSRSGVQHESEFRKLLESRYGALKGQRRRAADYLLTHYRTAFGRRFGARGSGKSRGRG